jgi:hypothetical protein
MALVAVMLAAVVLVAIVVIVVAILAGSVGVSVVIPRVTSLQTATPPMRTTSVRTSPSFRAHSLAPVGAVAVMCRGGLGGHPFRGHAHGLFRHFLCLVPCPCLFLSPVVDGQSFPCAVLSPFPSLRIGRETYGVVEGAVVVFPWCGGWFNSHTSSFMWHLGKVIMVLRVPVA